MMVCAGIVGLRISRPLPGKNVSDGGHGKTQLASLKGMKNNDRQQRGSLKP